MNHCSDNPWGESECPLCSGFSSQKKQKRANGYSEIEDYLLSELMSTNSTFSKAIEE